MNKELISKANAELKRLMDWFEEHKKAFDYLDLKLHDVSYYNWDKAKEEFPIVFEEYKADDLFYWFCEDSYENMREYFREEGITYKTKQLGRTSSFYLHDCELVEFTGRYRDEFNWEYMLYNLINHYGYCDTVPDITQDGKIDENDQYLEDCETNLKYIATEMYDEITKAFGDTVKCYEYIRDFKEHQVEYYKEELEYRQDEILNEREAERQREEDDWLNLMNVIFA